MTGVRAPRGLGVGGSALWREVTGKHELDQAQLVQLVEACRMKDRLDKLDALARGATPALGEVKLPGGGRALLVVADPVTLANKTADTMKQLLQAMRLPDESGRRPQRRGARGVYRPQSQWGSPR